MATIEVRGLTKRFGAVTAVDVSLLDREVVLVVAGLLLATALYGLLGVSVGSLIRNPAAAVTTHLTESVP